MRTLTVQTKQEFEYVVNDLAVMGYKIKQEAPGISIRLTKRKKVSAGFCILWFLFGLLPLIIYLIYCAVREPQDDVLVRVEIPQESDPTEEAPTNSDSTENEEKVVEVKVKKHFMTGWGATDLEIAGQLSPYTNDWEIDYISDIPWAINRTTRLYYVTLRRPKTEDSEEEPSQDE